MAKGRAVAIVIDDAERRELTALTRKHGAGRYWRIGRASFWLPQTGSIATRRARSQNRLLQGW